MTRAIRGFEWSRRYRDTQQETVTVKSPLLIGLLAVLLLVSAFSVIYLKDLSRRLFMQYQQMQQMQQHDEIEWSKLLLEEGARSTQARIQDVANKQLGMIVPAEKQIIMIRE